MSGEVDGLWTITCLFNPVGSRRRLANYHRFRAALRTPLATIELGFGGRWELGADDADLYLRVSDGDVLWQKEALLNRLLQHLPKRCRYVAWIDADILLPDHDWPVQAVAALATAPLVQLYASVEYLDAEGQPDVASIPVPATVASVLAGHAPQTVLGRATERTAGAATPGMAWAARRTVLERHGFYDACIIGGGDTAFACAAYGVPAVAVGLHAMTPPMARRYLAWAERLHGDLAGRADALPGRIQHLWHGELRNRRAALRHMALRRHAFDPATDLRRGRDGAWRWASDKPGLHDCLREYFSGRADDGAPA